MSDSEGTSNRLGLLDVTFIFAKVWTTLIYDYTQHVRLRLSTYLCARWCGDGALEILSSHITRISLSRIYSTYSRETVASPFQIII